MGLIVTFGFVSVVSLCVITWGIFEIHKMNKKKEQYR